MKGAYGRVDAPYLWFLEFKTGLVNRQVSFTLRQRELKVSWEFMWTMV
jgi:hypothetical protein